MLTYDILKLLYHFRRDVQRLASILDSSLRAGLITRIGVLDSNLHSC